MLYVIVLVVLVIIVASIIGFGTRQDDWDVETVGIFIGSCSFLVMIIWLMILLSGYLDTKAGLVTIDKKIAVVSEQNNERIESVLPILEKYPEFEKEIIDGIDPQAFAVLGDVYPNLRSNESYVQQASLVSSNITKIEELQLEKIELERQMLVYQYQLWFLK